MELILIRHGEPNVDADPADPPLSELGQRQAAATSAFLADTHLDAIYVSPQIRARQTSEAILAERGLVEVVDERIAEFDYGTGLYMQPSLVNATSRFEAMEALKSLQGPDFHARVKAGMDEIIATNQGAVVAAVCHGGVINSYVSDVTGATEPIQAFHASITRIAASSKSGVRSLLTFNEAHWIPRRETPAGPDEAQ